MRVESKRTEKAANNTCNPLWNSGQRKKLIWRVTSTDTNYTKQQQNAYNILSTALSHKYEPWEAPLPV